MLSGLRLHFATTGYDKEGTKSPGGNFDFDKVSRTEVAHETL